MESLYNLMVSGTFKVGIVAGDNRYETAVNVAKAQNLPKVESKNAQTTNDEKKNNIVLVNGNSLVDGLSAAPLAASLNWNARATGTAVLLSDTDSLPSATKEYLEELTEDISKANKKYVTINLVGGESVLSESLVKELKGMGFNVVRFGGDNREETSIEVAEELTSSNDLFVVGGNGEADAMSIAAVAAREGNPIIVESKNGLSEKALDEITKWKHDFDYANGDKLSATIVGGESVVSKATLKKLQSKDIATDRVHGSNRQKTNAAVIRRYYKTEGINHVVVSKDGSNNKKRDLIDALTATSLSVQHKAPIVLGTNKLDIEQMSALNQKANRTGVYVYQVGHGVARDVVKAIANRFSLSK